MNRLLKTSLILMFSCFAWNVSVMAQQKTDAKLPREVPSPEKIAKKMCDELQSELQLTDKQYKKVYKLYLKEQKARFSSQQADGASGTRPPMREGNADFEGGDGFPPAMGGERPDFGQRPGNGNVSKEEMMAAQKKKEQSMKKILNPEQYEKWLKLDKKKDKPKDGKIKANQ